MIYVNRAPMALFITATILLAGCVGPGDDPSTFETDTVRILVTQNMGTTITLDENVTLQDEITVMELLQSVTDVETAHDGAFVVSIDGEKNGYPEEKTDWFYHINGRLAGSGAAHQSVAPGDVVVWDHRPWNHTMTLPWVLAGTGSWPGLSGDILSPANLSQKTPDPHLFIRVEEEHLVVLDAWARPTLALEPPWLVAHVSEGERNEAVLLVAASSDEARSFIDSIDAWTPRGLGVVITPEATYPIPAAT